LGNPFTADQTSSIAGKWIFFGSTTQAYNVVTSGGIAPNTYPSPQTWCTDCYVSSQFTVTAGVASAQGIPPIQVNGDNTVHTGPIQISCEAGGCANIQPATPDPLGTQSVLIYPTCAAGDGATCFGGASGTVFSANTGEGLVFTFSLPACVNPSNVTDAYIYVTSSADIPVGLPTNFSIATGSGGGSVADTDLVPPGGGGAGIGGQPLWATSTVGQHFTILPTNYSAVQVIAFGSFGFTGYLTISNVVMRVYYSGAACPAQTAINLDPPLSWNVANSSIFISSPFANAIDVGAVNVYTANVLLLDAANGGHPVPGDSVRLFVAHANTSTAPTLQISNATDTSNRTIVNAPVTGSSTTTVLSVGQLQIGIPYTLTLDQAGKWEIQGAGGGISYPAGTGIPQVSSGSAWGSTLTPSTFGGFFSGLTNCATATDVWSPASNQCYPNASGGSVTDGSGVTTAGEIATSTTTAHQIQYGTALPNGTTATTQTTGDNTAKVATDAFVLANAGSGGGGGTSGWSGTPLTFGANATQFSPWVGGGATSTTESLVQNAAPAISTISGLQVAFSASLGAGTMLAVTLRDAGASTALTCTTSSGGTTCSDLSHTVNVTRGDLLDFQMVASGTVTAGLPQIVISYVVGSPQGNVVTQVTGPSSTVVGALTFAGSGVSQSGSTFTFSGGGGSGFPYTVFQQSYGVCVIGTSCTATLLNTAQSSGATLFILAALGGTGFVNLSCPSGWTQDFDETSSDTAMLLCHVASASQTSATITWTGGNSLGSYLVFELSGARTLDVSSLASRSGISTTNCYDYQVLPSITPTAGSLMFGFAAYDKTAISLGIPFSQLSPQWMPVYSPGQGNSYILAGFVAQSAATNTATTPPVIEVGYSGSCSAGGSVNNTVYGTFSIK
jgi:hypothetical protein